MSLYLLANTFYDEQPASLLVPEGLAELFETMDGIIGESERATRRYLIKIMPPKSEKARSLPIYLLNEHSSTKDVEDIANMVTKEGTWGLVTDAGLPCIADPGAPLVAELRRRGYESIQAVGGASSFIMALQLSGLSGQRFSFHGYLPCDAEKRRKIIRQQPLDGTTHICMETPYRTHHLYADLVATLPPDAVLCVAQEVGTPNQKVRTKSVAAWRKYPIECGKVPTVFLWANTIYQK